MITLNNQYNFHSSYDDSDKSVSNDSLRPYQPGDDFYEALIEAHRDLTDKQSQRVNARLVLILSNHIGDLGVLNEALNAARSGFEPNS